MDLLCSLALGIVILASVLAYAVRVAFGGRARSARVEREGQSMLMGKGLMEMLVWCAQPVVRGCAGLGLSADAVTWASLVLGVSAGVAFGAGHFGLGAVLAVLSGAGDTIDGLLAKQLGTSSNAGEVLDSAADRYVDFAWMAGLSFYFRSEPWLLLLALMAGLGATMVSYSTAKAEALGVKPPRGSMRRVERVTIIIVGAALTPVIAELAPSRASTPMVVALLTIAALANASALRRLAAIRANVMQDPAE